MTSQTFFEQIYTALNRQDNHIIIMVVYLAIIAIALFLRVSAHLHFRGALLSLMACTRKEIKEKGEVASLKNKLLRKAAAEYIRTAERAAAAVPTRPIVERAVAKMSFIGWRYESILPFIEGIETGLLWIGLVLALAFSGNAFMYGSLAVIAFVLTRLCAAFFDARAAKAEIVDETILYLEREIGRFFVTDTSGVILRLKNDLTEVMKKQAAAYNATVENIANVMASSIGQVSDSMKETTLSIGPTIAAAVDAKMLNMNTSLQATLDSWEKALKEAVDLQTSMNDSAEKMSYSSGKLQSSSELLATHMQGHSNALSNQLMTLVDAIDAVKDAVGNTAAGQEALTQQAKYIERNQHVLESSIHAYEESLKNLTQSLGEGLGAFINLHAQTSAQAVNDALKANVDKLMNLIDRAK